MYERRRYILFADPWRTKKRIQNLNFLYENYLMNLIEPILQDTMTSRDLTPLSTLTLSLFTTTCVVGWYLYHLVKKTDVLEGRLQATIEKTHEVMDVQDVHTESLHEYTHRLREKKDYDESEEVQSGMNQAWKGVCKQESLQTEILIWREKESTLKKNQEWLAWDGERDAACIVRDFYLGNSDPSFSWIVPSAESTFEAQMLDTMVNGWDSVIKIKICISSSTEQPTLKGSDRLNTYLKGLIEGKHIEWSRILLSSSG